MALAPAMSNDPQLDCYAILGLPHDADDAEIREAYKKLAARYQAGGSSGSKDEARRRLADLTIAYEVLADPQRRRRYDFHCRIRERTASALNHPSSADTPPHSIAGRAAARLRARRRRLTWITLSLAVVIVAAASWYSGSRSERAAPKPAAAANTVASVNATTPAEAKTPPPATNKSPAPSSAPTEQTAIPPPQSPQDTRAASGKPTKTAQNHAANAAPPSAPAEPCTDVTTALGLCKQNSNPRER
jgi:curved DNA-binding protein CbpA